MHFTVGLDYELDEEEICVENSNPDEVEILTDQPNIIPRKKTNTGLFTQNFIWKSDTQYLPKVIILILVIVVLKKRNLN